MFGSAPGSVPHGVSGYMALLDRVAGFADWIC